MDEIDIHAKLAQIETAPHFSMIFDGDTERAELIGSPLFQNVFEGLFCNLIGYPINFIPSVGTQPKTVIFLTADAFGVLPPISKLDLNQAMYYFVSGYTSKLAGTERGITSPEATFSTLICLSFSTFLNF